jgi:iron complex transport system substrate-binding protein
MKRVLSLLPSATEIIFALDAAEALVGVTHECDFPPEARLLPTVTSARIDSSMESGAIDQLVREQLEGTGTLYALDLPRVRSLRPELVLTQQLCTVCAVGYETVRAAMRTLDEPPDVVNLEPTTLQEVFQTFIDVGRDLGIEERARQLVVTLGERLASIPHLQSMPAVLFLEWLVPPFSAGHWMTELVEAAGGRPILADRGGHSRALTWEDIRAAAFDTLVISCCGFDVERTMRDVEGSIELQTILAERPELRLIVFDGNHFFSRPGPRLVESAELLNRALRGIAPEKADASIADPYRLVR